MDLSDINFQKIETFDKFIDAINMGDCTNCMSKRLGYHSMGEYGSQTFEIEPKNEEGRQDALNERRCINGKVVDKELERKLKLRFGTYRKVVAYTHLLEDKSSFYASSPMEANLNNYKKVEEEG
ncbi:hypothetical protein K502DRAFT_352022 [Neoconidiobolus thromboides FSU 785]|nr:hypothetical protein K502DRAFT_352022 [Neoconidiobolus thromboides FSU 785]